MADAVTWYIVDGDLPFLYDFPTQYELEYTSDVLWQIEDGTLPYKKSFAELHGFSDAPDAVWVIQDGELPYKKAFPPLYPPIEPVPPTPPTPPIEYDIQVLFKVILNCGDMFPNELDILLQYEEDLNAEIAEFEELIETIPIDKTLDEYADMYNEVVNGNIDYHDRNFFIESEVMHEAGWDNFPDDSRATTFYQIMIFQTHPWEIAFSPIVNKNTILSPEELGDYVESFNTICDDPNATLEDILEADTLGIIGYVYDYIPQGNPIEDELADIKEAHMILMEYDYSLSELEKTQEEITKLENANRSGYYQTVTVYDNGL